MINKQISMDEALYMVTLPSGSIRYLDNACLDYLGLHEDTVNSDSSIRSQSLSALNINTLDTSTAQTSKLWQELFPPEWQHPALKAIDLVCKNNKAASFEFDEGKLGKSLVTIKPLCDDESNIIALAWHGKPLVKYSHYQSAFESSVISQWVVALAPIRHTLSAFNIQSPRALSNASASSDFLAALRQSFLIKRTNNQTLKLFSCDEVTFKSDFYQNLPDEHLLQIAQCVLEGTVNKRQDFFLVNSDAESTKNIWLSFELPPEADKQNDGALLFSALDISALKKAERTIEEREKFLDAVLKTIPDYLFVINLETLHPIFKNKSLAEDLGFDVPDSGNLLQLIQAIAHPDDHLNKELLRSVYKRLLTGNIFETSIRLKNKKGEWRQLYFRCAAMEKDTQGKLLNAVVIARDMTDVVKAEALINEKQKQYQLLADNYNDAVIATGCSLNTLFVSPSIAHVLDYEEKDFLSLESPLHVLGLSNKKTFLERVLTDASLSIIKEDYSEVIESEITKASGERIQAEIKISVLRDSNKKVEGMLFVVRDITQKKRYEHDRILAAKVFENSTDGIYITDTQGNIEQVNQSFCQITGHDRQAIIGQKPSILGSGWHEGNFESNIRPTLEKTGGWSGELMSRRNNGEAFLVAITITAIHNVKQQVSGYITSFKDITEAKSSEEHVKKLAYFDPLTELPNRMLFQDRLYQAMQRGVRNRHYVAVLFLDLDGFKPVNDRHGHAVGDKLLTQVAERLSTSVRGDDTVARLGGDEFAVILHSLKDRNSAESTSAK
ncbi:MAG: PAS domain S-box protein, partial [Sinobacterium sp.]|nr:PAS domain S-box protein [Sinobacterium sp.]